MSDELKPCPFCGKQMAKVGGTNRFDYNVTCGWCNVSNIEAGHFSQQGAIEAWNTRHTPDITELQAENAQLRERLAAVEGRVSMFEEAANELTEVAERAFASPAIQEKAAAVAFAIGKLRYVNEFNGGKDEQPDAPQGGEDER